MRFTFCPDCGARLSSRELGDEGMVPWCDNCAKPWFDIFPSCVIALVTNERDEVLLLHQSYISTIYCNLVSGYMTPGECAETTVRREIREETGLEIDALELVGTWWFDRKELLMIGFIARAKEGQTLRLSQEVDAAEWQPAAKAMTMVHPPRTDGSVSTSNALTRLFLTRLQNGESGIKPNITLQ